MYLFYSSTFSTLLPVESASRPQMSFGELNDNMIKELMFYLRYHEQGFIYVSIYVLTHVSRNQIKENSLLKVKHVVTRNEKQVFMQWQYTVSIHSLTYLKNMWDKKLVESIIARLHGVKQKEKTYTYVLHIGLIFWSLQCLEYCYQIIVTKQDKHIMKQR